VNAWSVALEAATIRQQCQVLRMPTIAAQCTQLAEQAVRERRTHFGYLEALLQAELEEREQRQVERRLSGARLPRLKTLEESTSRVIPRSRPSKSSNWQRATTSPKRSRSSLSAIAVAACQQKRSVRFTTAAGLINEMVEAKHQLQLGPRCPAGRATI
jgi:DNA replication protein DnaC